MAKRRKIYLCCGVLLLALATTQTNTGHIFLWRVGLCNIDASVIVGYYFYDSYNNIPDLIDMPIKTAISTIRGIKPVSDDRNRRFALNSDLWHCDEYYELGGSAIFIGVKYGKIVGTKLVKG
jgi:hypothetical protein